MRPTNHLPLRSVSILAAVSAWSAGGVFTSAETGGLETPPAVVRIENDEIQESSGLVRSRMRAGVFWTHNDSGDRPRVFAITRDGRTLAEFAVQGAQANDWEDIAIDDAGHLYLADVGNNENRRRDLAVYRIPEPDPAGASRAVTVDRVLRYRYADQTAFPEPGRTNFDAEAVFWHDGSIYILTKHRTDTQTTLYRLPDTPHEGERALSPIAQLDLGWSDRRKGNVTAADLSSDGRTLALLTYRFLLLYEVGGGGDELELRPLKRIELNPLVTRQAESVCWDGEGLLFGNEQRSLFRIADPRSDTFVRFPPE